MEEAPAIAILTDYGTTDPFAGILKGVIRGLAPTASLIDLTHDVAPGDVRAAAIHLWQASPYFPPGTVFLCVVDPGVGTERRGVIVHSQGQTFIGPDNGLFSFILDANSGAWELSNPDLMLADPSTTFHGRDIFAPAAAHASRGLEGSAFGPRVADLRRLDSPKLGFGAGPEIHGEILLADHFGNLLTSLGKFTRRREGGFELHPWIPIMGESPTYPTVIGAASRVQLPGGAQLSWAGAFAAIRQGEVGFLVGGSGLIEIAANRDSAERRLNLSTGETLILIP